MDYDRSLSSFINPLPPRSRTAKKPVPVPVGDRLIPTRTATTEANEKLFVKINPKATAFEERLNTYTSKLTPYASGQSTRESILFFGSPQQNHENHASNNLEQQFSSQTKKKYLPKITFTKPRALDAPNAGNDFYDNLLTWSTSDRVSIALNAPNGSQIHSVSPLRDAPTENITSSPPVTGKKVNAVASLAAETVVSGWNDGYVRLHRTGEDHYDERNISSSSIHVITAVGPQTIMCGNAHSELKHMDFRQQNSTISTPVSTEKNKIPGLTYDGNFYLASGSNNNTVTLWDIRNLTQGPVQTNTQHKAGIKALAFWPHAKRYLISGGGSACGNLCLWDTTTNTIKHTFDTGSQITGIHCFKYDPRYFISSHGYSHSSIKLWHISNNTFSLQLSHDLKSKSQNNRALCLTGSPNTHDFAALTESETLQFFKPHGLKSIPTVKNTSRQSYNKLSVPKELSVTAMMR